MESHPGKSAKKKVMRAGTVFTGAAAATVAFAPAALANTQVPQPYRMTVFTGFFTSREQVCAYKDVGAGQWTCTPIQNVRKLISGSVSFGNNWKDGKVNVWYWVDGLEYLATCNTNSAYYGHFKAAGGVSLTGPSNEAMGEAAPGGGIIDPRFC
jgi:hypothetical protein